MDTDTFSLFVSLLTVAANVFVVATVAVALAARRGVGVAAFAARARAAIARDALTAAWVVATVCTAGSLYLSEVADFPPCDLCWYQRIAMYPLVVVLGIAALRRDVDVWRYVLPLVAIGAAISIYHYQLERFPEQSSLSCSVSVPCTTVWIWRFHYISIPFMALSGFAAIATLVLLARRRDDGA
jgi:disulfide bond formation protein DsbB